MPIAENEYSTFNRSIILYTIEHSFWVNLIGLSRICLFKLLPLTILDQLEKLVEKQDKGGQAWSGGILNPQIRD